MWNKFKIAIGVAVSVIVGVLFVMFKIEKSEKKSAEVKADKFEDAATENAKVIEQVKHEQKVKNDVSKLSNDDIRNGLLQSARDRNKV